MRFREIKNVHNLFVHIPGAFDKFDKQAELFEQFLIKYKEHHGIVDKTFADPSDSKNKVDSRGIPLKSSYDGKPSPYILYSIMLSIS